MDDRIGSQDELSGTMSMQGVIGDDVPIKGRFSMRCTDRDGNELWSEEFDNLITTVGKNFLLDTTLAGSAYTVTGPFMGLISSVGFSAVNAADTMGSHAGWNEAQGSTNVPDYTGNRQTPSFSAASGGVKAFSAPLAYVFTSAGTLQGAFMALGSGASATKNNTGGTLFNAGTLSVARQILIGDTIAVSYSVTLTG